MRPFRLLVEFAIFLTVFLAAYTAYQLNEQPTKFIYYNF